MLNAIFSKNFKKSFKKKDKIIQEKVKIRIRLFREDPNNLILNNHKLSGEYEGCSSINITGDYRVVFEFLDKNTVNLVDIGTHSELYE
ncbi:MAG: type II toxin-antitoxin system mRNA interferase toxin, RelE/StbE family [Candidatus Nomurabacteria bacterium]|nr:type II toxin-antitoxin system mRNA interferase toxin, RelE/StbE family [Candidatus Nomurabacteria bacterium]